MKRINDLIQKLTNVGPNAPALAENSVGNARNARRRLLFCVSALTLAALSTPIRAQAPPSDTKVQTLASTVNVYPAPPADFDPVSALPSELEQYGIPPRPDSADAVPFARWKKLVTSPQTRLTNVTAKATNVIHGPVRNAKVQGIVGNTTAVSSENWSAYVVTDEYGTFMPNNSFIEAEWTVPAVGVENCNNAPYMSSQWVGFDGYTSLDVLQAGTEVDGCPSTYYAWYEWYTDYCVVNSASLPCYSYSVTLPVNPGDLMFIEVWYTTNSPNGHAYLYNSTIQQSASISFNQPPTSYPPAQYQGNSVEWVVERPYIGSFPNLTNYVADVFNFAMGQSGYSPGPGAGPVLTFYPGSSPSGSKTFDVSMTCPPWTPISLCQSTTDISVVNSYGLYTLWFSAQSPAYQ
jgi:hypothetical protein